MNTRVVRKYLFNNKTDFTYAGYIDISVPEDSEEYYVTDYQTLTPPLETKENEICAWNGYSWEIVPDFRYTNVFYTSNGNFSQYNSIGKLPDELTDTPKPDVFYTWSKKKSWVVDKNLEKQHITELKLKERQEKFNSVDWIVLRHMEQISTNKTPSIDENKYKEILEYKQYLRDLTEDKNWPNIQIKDPPLN